MEKFENLSDKEVYMLKIALLESSLEVLYGTKYNETEKNTHTYLVYELCKEDVERIKNLNIQNTNNYECPYDRTY